MKNRGCTVVELLALLAILAAGFGWFANIYKLTTMTFDPITTILIIRAIGIFVPPVGAVMGYL